MENPLKISPVVVLFAAFGVAVVGCKPSDDGSAENAPKPIDEQLVEAKDAVEEAGSELEELAYSQRQEFIKSMNMQLAELTKDLGDISDQIEKSSSAVKVEAAPKLASLKGKIDVMEKQLEALEDAEASTWEMAKEKTGQAYADLKDGFNDMRQWLGDKIAP